MWVTLLISPVKKRIFCPKTTKFGPKLAFLVILGQAMQAYSVPCLWVGWWLWRAGCISQDTYLLYTYVVSKVVFNGAVCTYIVCKVVSHWCSLHARWCNVSCQLQRLLERSLSSSSFSSSPSPYLEHASRPGLVRRGLTMNPYICSLCCLCLQ